MDELARLPRLRQGGAVCSPGAVSSSPTPKIYAIRMKAGERVDMVALPQDGAIRRADGFRLVARMTFRVGASQRISRGGNPLVRVSSVVIRRAADVEVDALREQHIFMPVRFGSVT
ncbi:hypothetical protein [Ralstonia soli]|uniref:Uncharacterized protein n=1 Tax=Ralstonia soli TaxID=2953896 RepID=A0ABT1AKZ1_9RALS|nr:hypothetical protein [Ralstonia soli]MCO5399053.1 hypothetical protein [Ralstonia soli]